LSAGPPLTTDPPALASDGSTIDHCDLPVLDDTGKKAADISKVNTPGWRIGVASCLFANAAK
jgi:hypothetical protein